MLGGFDTNNNDNNTSGNGRFHLIRLILQLMIATMYSATRGDLGAYNAKSIEAPLAKIWSQEGAFSPDHKGGSIMAHIHVCI